MDNLGRLLNALGEHDRLEIKRNSEGEFDFDLFVDGSFREGVVTSSAPPATAHVLQHLEEVLLDD